MLIVFDFVRGILTSLQSYCCTRSIDARILLFRVTEVIVRVDKRIRYSTIVRHCEVIDTLAQARLIRIRLRRASNVVFPRDFSSFDLVVDSLTWVPPAVKEHVVEERNDAVLWYCGVREPIHLELLRATVQADVAVEAGEGSNRGHAVELDWEG